MILLQVFLLSITLSSFSFSDRNMMKGSEQSAPQVLMNKCPLSSRCVGRQFCDEDGLITTYRNNRLKFSEDQRGFIACVVRGKNRLGVCCVDNKQKRRTREQEISEKEQRDIIDDENHDEYSGVEDELFEAEQGSKRYLKRNREILLMMRTMTSILV